MYIKIVQSLKTIPASQWDALIPNGEPFLQYEFLYGLEKTRCTDQSTGWQGHHLIAYADEQCQHILGALPCYLKTHSYGEYIFDWAWADAYQRAGLNYYPKLSCAIPFTPVTGPRWLIAAECQEQRQKLSSAFIEKLLNCAKQLNLSSVHFLFTQPTQNAVLAEHQFIQRHSSQFHWKNNHYQQFSDFCSSLSAKKRKNILRERRRIKEANVRFKWFHGETLTPAVIDIMYQFYCRTIHRYGAQQYLNQAFFHHLQQTLATHTHVLLAFHEKQAIAGGLYFSSQDTLYGRYWGATHDFHSLHFETCYYQPIEYCIQQGIKRFEAGAQGEHKLSRGLLPTTTYSMHYLFDERFQSAVLDYIDEERHHIQRYNQLLHQHSPFKEI